MLRSNPEYSGGRDASNYEIPVSKFQKLDHLTCTSILGISRYNEVNGFIEGRHIYKFTTY